MSDEKTRAFASEVMDRVSDIGRKIDAGTDGDALDAAMRHAALSVRLLETVHERRSQVRHVRLLSPAEGSSEELP